MNQRLLVFDWIRSIAILIILFHHLPNYTFDFYNLNYFGIPANFSALNELNRYFGLSLFVFVSGYLINVKPIEFSTWNTISSFAKQRFIRIFPLYYLGLICFCIMDEIYDVTKIIFQIFGLQLIFRTPLLIPIRTLWFVGLVTVYYSMFIILKSNKFRKIYKVGILTFLLIFFLTLNRFFSLTDLRLSLYYLVFLFGIFCSEKQLFRSKIWIGTSYLSALLLVFLSIYFFTYFTYYETLLSSEDGFLVKYLLLNALMLSFDITTYNVCQWLMRHLKFERVLKALAYASYCMYLFHRPIWWIMKEIPIDRDSGNGQYLLLALLIFCGMPLIFGFSYGLQVLYDKHFKPKLLYLFK